jgi:hypothetical protein
MVLDVDAPPLARVFTYPVVISADLTFVTSTWFNKTSFNAATGTASRLAYQFADKKAEKAALVGAKTV